jgi:hypothetical protein
MYMTGDRVEVYHAERTKPIAKYVLTEPMNSRTLGEHLEENVLPKILGPAILGRITAGGVTTDKDGPIIVYNFRGALPRDLPNNQEPILVKEVSSLVSVQTIIAAIVVILMILTTLHIVK